MSKYTFIQELENTIEDQAILESTDKTAGLTRSTFYKQIKAKHEELATALEGFWGHIDFVEFVQLTLNSIKLKRGKWKNLEATSQEHLAKLVELHNKLFPSIAKKIEKLPTNYSSKEAVSAASAGRRAEREWLAGLNAA
jgi:hypothetical protein